MRNHRTSRRLVAALLMLGLGLACQQRAPETPPYQRITTAAMPRLQVEPLVGMSGQYATVTATGLATLARPEWRWARLTVDAPDGARPVDSMWAVPSQMPIRRQWRLQEEGSTTIALSLYTDNLTQPDWHTRILLDTHEFNLVQWHIKGGQMEKKSTVNSAGNYTKPAMREKLFKEIKSADIQGTSAGQWSARKAQLLAKRYKEKGGGYK